MSKGKFFLLHLSSVIVLLLGACTSKGAADANVAATDTICGSYMLPAVAATAGFTVDLEVPTGNSNADKAMREFILQAINDDIFYPMGHKAGTVPVPGDATFACVATALERSSEMWNKEYLERFPECDTMRLRLTSSIKVRRVAETDGYVTYHYEDYQDFGGAHGLPFSYFVTYDKVRAVIVTADNTVAPGKAETLKRLVLENLNKLQTDKASPTVFSIDNIIWGQYPCDVATPLPHLAILPQGIVFTYHRYQIDNYAAGEYTPQVSKEEAEDCLLTDFWQAPAPGSPVDIR